MSFGALSANAKEALGQAASIVGTSTTTGDGGMHKRERDASKTLVYQVTPSHYGNNPHHMRQADAVEIVIGQGAKPGTGGVLLGFKVSDEVASMRDLPVGVDQRSPVRHPDFIGADDLRLKIEEVREATGHRVAHLREDRRLPGLRRRPPRREGRSRGHRHRRHGRRDGRIAPSPARPHGRPDARRGRGGPGGAHRHRQRTARSRSSWPAGSAPASTQRRRSPSARTPSTSRPQP